MATKRQLRRRLRRSAEGNSLQPFFKSENEQEASTAADFFFTPAVGTVQAKLTVNPPGDAYEQEADRMAEKVVNAPTAMPVQRAELKEEEQVSRLPKEEEEQISKKEQEEEEETTSIATKSMGNAAPSVSPAVARKIHHSRGMGSLLPKRTMQEMSTHFGYDFGHVHIHTNQQAENLSDQIHAQAFTNGSDIFFNKGKFNPETQSGKKLLAHELTHVVQQSKDNELQRLQRQQAPGISTPVPNNFKLVRNKRKQVIRATGIINGVAVTINPDTTGTVPAGSSGETKLDLRWRSPGMSHRNGVVTQINGRASVTLAIRTTYRKGVDPDVTSGYGRGTTPQDQAAGNTSLRFHEGSHGTTAMDFLRTNPLPAFGGAVGMTVQEYQTAQARFDQEMNRYQSKLHQANIQSVDCVGAPAAFCTP